jgi:hypothetical protein
LHNIFGDHLKDATIQKSDTGLNSWIEDVVVTLAAYDTAAHNLALPDDLGLLAEALWGTSYKAVPVGIPKGHLSSAELGAPDIAVRQSELRKWLLDGDISFSRSIASPRMTNNLPTLARSGQTGAFVSANLSGLTVLIVSTRQPFEIYRPEFRKFALDTDIVLGSVWLGSDMLAFVGRERQVPVTVAPPLRFETVRILVSTNKKELAQSYERTQLLRASLRVANFKDGIGRPCIVHPN